MIRNKYFQILIISIAGLAAFRFTTGFLESKKRKQTVEQKIESSINSRLIADSIVDVSSRGDKIKLLKRYGFAYMESTFVAVSLDSHETGVIITSPNKDSDLDSFFSNFSAKNPTFKLTTSIERKSYQNGNFIESADVSFSNNGKQFSGVVFYYKKGEHQVIVQGSSISSSWSDAEKDVLNMINSYFELSN